MALLWAALESADPETLLSASGIERTVMPTPVGPTPRPDVQPVATGTHLLFARSGRIERVPLDGYRMKTEEAGPLLHIPVRAVTF